ncbi:unnamed protein product, partial [marine sediment metagenome]
RAVDKAGNERIVWIKPLKEAKELLLYWLIVLISIGIISWLIYKIICKRWKK